MEQKTPKTFINANIPTATLERIKATARLRANQERRHVPYVEILREVLEREFPEITPASDCHDNSNQRDTVQVREIQNESI